MKKIKGIDTNGNYLYEDNRQLGQKIQRVTNENENFLDILGEDTGDKLISLNKACELLKSTMYNDDVWGVIISGKFHSVEEFIRYFKKSMK